MKKIIIVDGNSLIYRAFYALPELMTAEGLHTNAIYGFLNMLNRVLEEEAPDYISVAFDLKAVTFRNEAYGDYKANRKKMPQELREQMPEIKELLDAYRIHRMEFEGFEGDDLIGTMAKACGREGLDVLVVTGDKDALQLVDDRIAVMLTKKGISTTKVYDAAAVEEEFGVRPDQIADFKGLVGDKSDNIPGVRGIGRKTAEELLTTFGTVENLYESIEEVEKQSVRTKLEKGWEEALLSKRLATIATNVPIEFSLEELAVEDPDHERLQACFRKYEFKSLLAKTAKPEKAASRQERWSQRRVESRKDLKRLSEMAERDHSMGLMAFAAEKLGSPEKVAVTASAGETVFLLEAPWLEEGLFKDLLEDEDIEKFGYGLKETVLYLKSAGLSLRGLAFDLKVAEHMLHPSDSDYDLSRIVAGRTGNRFPYETLPETEDGEACLAYGGEALQTVHGLRKDVMEELESEGLLTVFSEIEIPLIDVLSEMEHNGFYVDIVRLKELDREFTGQLEKIEKAIYEDAGEVFNINSTQQTGHILFEKLGLKAVKKTKTGFSTSQKVLEKLAGKHPIVPKIMEYRKFMKLKSTYVDGLGKLINPETGRLHPRFNQTATVTGRLSTKEPNLQNIPVRLEMGRKLRQIFVAEGGRKLVDADYSQIELRVLAHLSEDEGLVRAFREEVDIHTLTASQVFDVPLEAVSSLQRSRAKEVNFGILYGMSDFGLSNNIGISVKEAGDYIEAYFNKYPDVKRFMDRQVREAKRQGFVRTLSNRKRMIPELNSSNHNVRSFGERMAMNTPIQGSAADIIKIAMIKIHREMRERNMASKLVLQIHDELIIEAVPEELEAVQDLMKRHMEQAVALKVPLVIDMKVGDSWYETK